MKRLPILFLAFSLSCIPSSLCLGQSLNGYGIRAGLGKSTLSSNLLELEPATGFHLSLAREVRWFPVLYYQFELGYTRCGYRNEQLETDGSGNLIALKTATSRLHYFSWGSLFYIRGPSIAKLNPFLVAGHRLDWLVDSTPGYWDFTTGRLRDNLTDGFSKLDIAGVIGFGAILRVPSGGSIRLEVCRYIGLIDLLPDSDDHTIKLRGLEISLSLFPWESALTRR
jgi:hypothetical protein